MNKNKYDIIGIFECNGKTMLIVKMSGATCVMPIEDYNRIIITERKHGLQKNLRVA